MGNNVFQSPFNITSAAIAAALGYTPLNKAGDTMSGALTVAQGTITANAPGLNLTATWNNAGTTFQGIRLNVTDRAKAAASSLMTLTTSSGGLFDVSPTGGLTVGGSVFLGFNGRGYVRAPADGVFLLRNAAETDVDRLQFGGTTSSFPAIKKYLGAAMFQFRKADDSDWVDVELGCVRFAAKTVAGLGTPGGAGVVRYVTDAKATTSRSVLAGGGSNKVMVWSDGTNWLIF